jgi:hypothetical protein
MISMEDETPMCDCCDTTMDCGCGMMPHHRRFLTRSEEIENLKKYKQALENEIRGVEEHLAKLNS